MRLNAARQNMSSQQPQGRANNMQP
jgi:hypothetical protein